jgi:hypothetical protein
LTQRPFYEIGIPFDLETLELVIALIDGDQLEEDEIETLRGIRKMLKARHHKLEQKLRIAGQLEAYWAGETETRQDRARQVEAARLEREQAKKEEKEERAPCPPT